MERRCTTCQEIVGATDTYCPFCGARIASAFATWPGAPEPEPHPRPEPPPVSQEIVPLRVPTVTTTSPASQVRRVLRRIRHRIMRSHSIR